MDVEGLLGQDDNDFLGNLSTLALMHDIDYEEFVEKLGISAEFDGTSQSFVEMHVYEELSRGSEQVKNKEQE